MFKDTLDKNKFNIKLLNTKKYLNFSWGGSSVRMGIYEGYNKLEEFDFDNEIMLEYIIKYYLSENFFMKDEAQRFIANGTYDKDYKIESAMKQPYMEESFDLHMEDMNENSLYIICDREDFKEPYKLHLNETTVDVDAQILRRIRFCIGYVQEAQVNYERNNISLEE